MLFYLLCIYVSLYYIRPFEWYGPLRGMPIFSVLGVVCLLALFYCWATNKIRLFNYKTDYMMAGFVMAMILSHLRHGYVGGAIDSVTRFMPSLVCYFLIVHGLESKEKINRFVLLLIALSTFLGYEAWLQYAQGFSLGGLEPLYQNMTNSEGVRERLTRVRWYGMFNDPNDLGLALLVAVPFLFQWMFAKRYFLSAVCLPILVYGIYLTNSRGAILALIAAISTFLVLHYRSKKGVLLGLILTFAIILLGPSRMAEISAGESSAYGRIEAWYEGFQMFKEYPFFGVGCGMFTEWHSLTAHNSFVLVLAELGLFGTFFFLGLFYIPLRWTKTYLLTDVSSSEDKVANRSFYCAAIGSLAGLMMAMFFLSRSYIVLPFMFIGLITAAVNSELGAKKHEVLVFDYKENIYILLVFVFFIAIIVKCLI